MRRQGFDIMDLLVLAAVWAAGLVFIGFMARAAYELAKIGWGMLP